MESAVTSSLPIFALLLAVGCAHRPLQELIDTRLAYQKATQSETAELAPDELRNAQEALAAAEEAYERRPRSKKTADLLYIARRKVQIAEAAAEVAREKATLEGDKLAQRAEAERAAQEALLARTRQLLAEAEVARQEAMATLRRLADVSQEDRGLVLTLWEDELFAPGEAALLSDAQSRLAEIAQALLVTPGRRLLVEGHLGAQGPDQGKVELSQRRADAVRDFLVSRGYDASIVEARGLGDSRPLADERAAEGRMSDGRIEIIATAASETPSH